MTFHLQAGPRLPSVPWWALALVSLWLALLGVLQWLSRSLAEAPILCHFFALTHIPCPTCGTTRAFLALLDARPLDALALNPLMVVLGVAAVLILGWRLVSGRQLVITLAQPEKPLAGLLAAAVFMANWAYVIAAHAGH